MAASQQTVGVPGVTGEQRGARLPWLVAALALLGWLAFAGRYGFHRDELYFVEGGRHPALGQPDNPMLVPWMAAGWHELVGGRLSWFRVLPALAGCGTILAAARTAAALGGDARRQSLTAVFVALSAFPLGVGHLFSTATFDLLLTTLGVLAAVRAVGDPHRLAHWVRLGVVVGLALEVKLVAGMVVACCLVALMVLGPPAVRGLRLLRLGGFWLAVAVAAALATPFVIWQSRSGFPMLQVAASIAGGGSTSSADRLSVLPLMLLLVGPALGPLMVIGFVAPFRVETLRAHRWLSLGFALLAVLVVATGGKPYYLAGLFACGLALSTWPVLALLDPARWRRATATGLLLVTGAGVVVLSLPIAPVGSVPFQLATAVNPDTAETVGWDAVVDTTVAAVAALPVEEVGSTVVLTANYGEAGALARARRLGLGTATDTGAANPTVTLPAIYSGHNAFFGWGPPPSDTSTAILVGDLDPDLVEESFDRCEAAGIVSSPPGVENEEDGAVVQVCRGPVAPWAGLWPQFRRYR